MSLPQLTVLPKAAQRIRHFDCWIFRDELSAPDAQIEHGAAIELTDHHGAFLAYAWYSASSHIAARVVSLDRARPIDRTLLAGRIEEAVSRRAAISGTTARRLISSEADGLPGLIVDQYDTVLVFQSRTAGVERWKPDLIALLQAQLKPTGILERSDKEFREEDKLPPIVEVVRGAVPERIPIEEDGLRFLVDPYRGHKTGFYLDQRDTRRRLRSLITPGERVADVCAYTGAFGITAAFQGASVVCVEQDEALIALGRQHAALNGVESRLTWAAADAFYWLEAKASAQERFDWVLLDPPGLAKTKAEVQKGRQALHRLTVHALKLLAPNGRLLLSICSYHLLGLTEEILRIAAEECGMRLRMLGTSMQAADHPWILQMPATRYLISWVAQRDG